MSRQTQIRELGLAAAAQAALTAAPLPPWILGEPSHEEAFSGDPHILPPGKTVQPLGNVFLITL